MADRFLLNANQVAEARIQNAAIDRAAAAMVKPFARAIGDQMRAGAAALGVGSSVAGAVLLNSERLTAAYQRTYTTGSHLVARRILGAAKSLHGSRSIYTKADAEIETLATWNDYVSRFIQTYAAERVQQVTSTTIAQLQGIIGEGYADGVGVVEIQRRIYNAIESFSIVRARAISRTETHAAAMRGSLAAAQVIEVDTRKRWNATEDGRTRDDHADADGLIVDLSGQFHVGGDFMQFPGDPSAEAANVVNCRCVLDYPMV